MLCLALLLCLLGTVQLPVILHALPFCLIDVPCSACSAISVGVAPFEHVQLLIRF